MMHDVWGYNLLCKIGSRGFAFSGDPVLIVASLDGSKEMACIYSGCRSYHRRRLFRDQYVNYLCPNQATNHCAAVPFFLDQELDYNSTSGRII